MADKILAKGKLENFLAEIKNERDLFAPANVMDKMVWTEVGIVKNLIWDFSNTEMSPKSFFFPQTECMMTFVNNMDDPQGMVMQAKPFLNKSRILLNVRPCDAKAFRTLDLIFIQDDMTNDLYWRDKREKTLLIGLACNNPSPTCFCTSMDCGPYHEEGLDLLLVDLKDKILIRVLSENGSLLVKDLPAADDIEIEQAIKLKVDAENMIKSRIGINRINSLEILTLYEHPMWERVQDNCISCSVCTFCCPTCHCFDIQDEVQGECGRRVRNWDYCMSWLFTMHGTGYNPRGTRKDRVRQRFMHKFKYIPLKRNGIIGCVGCGRCIQLCPVNIDVRAVITKMNGY